VARRSVQNRVPMPFDVLSHVPVLGHSQSGAFVFYRLALRVAVSNHVEARKSGRLSV